jgi:chromosomal replication initiation ATPase DnaA
MTEQLTFALPSHAATTRENFLVSDCNAAALRWIDAFPNWSAPALLLIGEQGSGKTHLASIWQQQTGARYYTAAQLSTATIADWLEGDTVGCIVDDCGEALAEAALFHLYNIAKESGKFLLLVSRLPLEEWNISLPDLRSRLKAAPVAVLGLPDAGLFHAILAKLFADRQLQVSDDVLKYIVSRSERSFAAAHDCVALLDAAALQHKHSITIPFVREHWGNATSSSSIS